MMSPEERIRYSKQTILKEIGIDGQEKLKNAKVLVIGAGGLGCPVLQYLTAAGVGNIGIADGDTIELSNLQRQVLFTDTDSGQNKALVAAAKLRKQNPNVRFSIFPFFLNSGNALDIIRPFDIVVDGSDNFGTRYLVNDACVILNKPMVSAAIYQFEGQLSVFNYQDGPTYRCLFPEPPGEGESPNCADIGVVATLPGIMGTLQANEVLKMITGAGTVLSGRFLLLDALHMTSSQFQFGLVPSNKDIRELQNLPQYCQVTVAQVSYEEVRSMIATDPTVLLVDVREMEEHEISNIGGINIPLSVFEERHRIIDPACKVILYCASGTRSNRFGKMLIADGYSKVYNLQNGVSDLLIN